MSGSHTRRRPAWRVVVAAVLLAATFGVPAVTTPAARAAAGDLDTTFDGDGIVTDLRDTLSVGNDVAVQPDGRIVVVGSAADGPSAPTTFLVSRYLPDGSPDPTFSEDGTLRIVVLEGASMANGVAIQPDGRIVVAGYTDTSSGRAFALVRLLPNGALDTSFGSNGRAVTTQGAFTAEAQAVVVQPDGRLVVVGNGTFTSTSTLAQTVVKVGLVARYESGGSLDTTFGVNGFAESAGLLSAAADVVLAGPRVVVAGSRDGKEALAAFTGGGAPDTAFGTGAVVAGTVPGATSLTAVARRPDGALVAAAGIRGHLAVARYTAAGALDTSFGTNGLAATQISTGDAASVFDFTADVLLQPDGRIVAVGAALYLYLGEPAEASNSVALVRYEPSGALDASFSENGVVTTLVPGGAFPGANAGALQPDGKIVVAGTTNRFSSHLLVARYVADVVTMRVGDAVAVEGDAGTSPATFTVTLSAPATVPVTVGYATADGTAVAPGDYQPATGTLTFAPGESARTVSVAVVGDTEPEPEETFTLTLSGPAGASLSAATGTARIVDTDTVVPLGARIDDVAVVEGDEGTVDATFTVSLVPPAATAGARVSYATSEGTAAATDFQPTSGTLAFGPGESTRTVTVKVRGDRVDEGTERFTVTLSNPVLTPIADATGTGKISDDDGLVIDTLAGGPPLVERVVVRGDAGGFAVSRLCTDPRQSSCTDLTPPAVAAGTAPNPRTIAGTRFEVIDGDGLTPATSTVGADGLVAAPTLEIRLARPVPAVEITLVQGAGTPAMVEAFLTDGTSAGTATRTAAAGVTETLRLPDNPAGAVAQQPFGLATVGPYVYVADPANHLVRFLDTSPRVPGCPCESVLAGNGAFGAADDGDDPLQTELAGPYAVAAHRSGSGRVVAYVADTYGHRILRITPRAAGAAVTVVAGTGAFGFGGDGGPGPKAVLNSPYGIAVDAARDRVYFSDTLNNRVRMVDAGGTVTTVAGSGSTRLGGDGGPALSAGLDRPRGLALDADGNLFIADTGNHVVRRLDPATGIISRVAGTGSAGFAGDGGPAGRAELSSPSGVAVDGAEVLVADTGNSRVRRVSGGGTIVTVAGGAGVGFGGDGGPATGAALDAPFAVAVASNGDLLVADTGNNRVRRVSGGVITTLAGTGAASYAGSGLPARLAQLAGPASVATWRASDQVAPSVPTRTFVADTFTHTVRMVDQTGAVTTLAGTGVPGRGGDGGPGPAAQLDHPVGVAIDRASPPTAVFVADTLNNVVRRIDLASGIITTVAGGGSGGDGPALSATLAFPTGVAVDVAGNLYIAEAYGGRVRKVTPAGVLSTVAGSDVLGGGGDGGPGTAAQLFMPTSVAADGASPPTLVVADSFNHRARRIASDGTITALAGTGGQGSAGDGGPAGAATFDRPFGVGVDPGPGLQVAVADTDGDRARLVAGTGTVSRLAGSGAAGFAGDLGPAVDASLSAPRGVGPVVRDKLAMVGDTFGWRVRRIGPPIQRVTPDPVKFRVAGSAVGCTTTCPWQVVTVTNAGLATLHIRSAVLGGASPGDFRVIADRCSGIKLPPGSSCTFRVVFVPTVVCPDTTPCRNAVVTLDGNGADGAREVDLEGAVSRQLVTVGGVAKPSGDANGPGTDAVDTAVVTGPAGQPGPTGRVAFFLCGPSQVTAAGCPAGGGAVGAPVALSGGTATSPSTAASAVDTNAPGTYCWRVEYLGDGLYQPASYTNAVSGAGSRPPQCFVVRLLPRIGMRSAPRSGAPGSNFADEVGVSGGGRTPTGTLTWFLCRPGDPLGGNGCVSGGVPVGGAVTLSGGRAVSPGTASVPIDTTTFGQYCWRVSYSGDGLYLPATETGFVVFDGRPIFVPDCFFVSREFVVISTSATPGNGAGDFTSTDAVTVTGPPGSVTPTGQVRFFVCRPGIPATPAASFPGSPGRPNEVTNGLGCLNGGVEVLPAKELVGGKATSSPFTTDVAGLYCWRVEYAGTTAYHDSYHTNARVTSSGAETPECFNGVPPPGPVVR